MENVGFEPTTFRMQSEHSTPELIPLMYTINDNCKIRTCASKREFLSREPR